jgi:hypothetical protein
VKAVEALPRAGATSFFCRGKLDEDTTRAAVDAHNERKVNVIGVPGMHRRLAPKFAHVRAARKRPMRSRASSSRGSAVA